MSDRKIFDLNVMGCDWCVQLHFHDYGFDDNGKYIPADGGQNICINFRKMSSPDELISTLMDALFDSIIVKFCGENWDSKILANVVSQIFLNPKSRRVIDEMVTYYNRNHVLGEDYEKFNSDGEIESYLFDSIEINRPHYWGLEIWIANIEDSSHEFSRFGMTEDYILRIDPTQFNDGNEIAVLIDNILKDSTGGKFYGLEDVKPSYTQEQLQAKLKRTNLSEIKQRLIDEYDDIVEEFLK